MNKHDKDTVEAWYQETYSDDADVYNDFWLHQGYEGGFEWGNGYVFSDVWDALSGTMNKYPTTRPNAPELRRFARAYEKGELERVALAGQSVS